MFRWQLAEEFRVTYSFIQTHFSCYLVAFFLDAMQKPEVHMPALEQAHEVHTSTLEVFGYFGVYVFWFDARSHCVPHAGLIHMSLLSCYVSVVKALVMQPGLAWHADLTLAV